MTRKNKHAQCSVYCLCALLLLASMRLTAANGIKRHDDHPILGVKVFYLFLPIPYNTTPDSVVIPISTKENVPQASEELVLIHVRILSSSESKEYFAKKSLLYPSETTASITTQGSKALRSLAVPSEAFAPLLEEMRKRARKVGADAVIRLEYDYNDIAGWTITGTAIKYLTSTR